MTFLSHPSEANRIVIARAFLINRPLRGQIGEHVVRMEASSLPLADASVDRVTCFDVVEYVREDDTLLAECARVLKPGGTLELRVPNRGPLEGIDPLNLYRYMVDIIGRRPRPIETDEIGWRRHYSASDLESLLHPRFSIVTQRTQQTGLTAIIQTAVLLTCRFLLSSDALERRATVVVRRVEEWDDRTEAGDAGWYRIVTATRRPAAG